MSMPMHTNGLYMALFLSGLLGSLGHCLGMCGPLVVMVGLRLPVTGPAALPRFLLYHAARIGVYALLGLAVGGLGSLLGLGATLNRLAGVASLVLGLGVVALGLGYLSWLPRGFRKGDADERGRARTKGTKGREFLPGLALDRLMGGALRRGGTAGVVLTGALNGLLPCGLVYSALLATAAAGSALRGGLAMTLFGAGTLPALLAVGLGAGALSAHARQAWSRAGGFLIVVVGLQLAARGAAALRMVPHLQLGSVMLW